MFYYSKIKVQGHGEFEIIEFFELVSFNLGTKLIMFFFMLRIFQFPLNFTD